MWWTKGVSTPKEYPILTIWNTVVLNLWPQIVQIKSVSRKKSVTIWNNPKFELDLRNVAISGNWFIFPNEYKWARSRLFITSSAIQYYKKRKKNNMCYAKFIWVSLKMIPPIVLFHLVIKLQSPIFTLKKGTHTFSQKKMASFSKIGSITIQRLMNPYILFYNFKVSTLSVILPVDMVIVASNT